MWRRGSGAHAWALREELAADCDRMAESFSGYSADFAPAADGYRARAEAIRARGAVHVAGWALPDWARGHFGLNDGLILGEDDMLRPDSDS